VAREWRRAAERGAGEVARQLRGGGVRRKPSCCTVAVGVIKGVTKGDLAKVTGKKK
jgi:hypothetical protein